MSARVVKGGDAAENQSFILDWSVDTLAQCGAHTEPHRAIQVPPLPHRNARWGLLHLPATHFTRQKLSPLHNSDAIAKSSCFLRIQPCHLLCDSFQHHPLWLLCPTTVLSLCCRCAVLCCAVRTAISLSAFHSILAGSTHHPLHPWTFVSTPAILPSACANPVFPLRYSDSPGNCVPLLLDYGSMTELGSLPILHRRCPLTDFPQLRTARRTCNHATPDLPLPATTMTPRARPAGFSRATIPTILMMVHLNGCFVGPCANGCRYCGSSFCGCRGAAYTRFCPRAQTITRCRTL